MGPCKGLAYRRILPSGVLVTIAEPWGDPEFRALGREHAAEVWRDSDRLADDFVARLASEYEQGCLVPIIALAESEGKARIVGYNVLGYLTSPLTGKPLLGDWGLYVAKPYRRDGVALGMLEAQKQAAREIGVSECYAGYVSVDAHGLQQLYEKAGFRKALIGFRWEVGDVISL